MPRKRIQGKTRIEYGIGHRVQLRVGNDLFRRGFGPMRDATGNENPAVVKEMRQAWTELKDVVMATQRRHAGLFTRAWAWWKFDRKVADPPRDVNEQKKYLIEHNLLTDEEKSALG